MPRYPATAALALACALAGCALPPKGEGLGSEGVPTTQPPPEGPLWRGKLGYRLEAFNGARAQAGSLEFELTGSARAGQLRLISPLGTALARAQWTDAGAELDDGQQTQTYPSLEALGSALGQAMAEGQEGSALPLTALFHWLEGKPDPGQAVSERDASGFLQGGWRVQATAEGNARRLTVTRLATATAPLMTLRFLLAS